MRNYHSKTLSREFKTVSPSHKKASMSSSQDTEDTLAAVSSVRRQLKTLMTKALDLNAVKRTAVSSQNGQLSDLVEACSRLETNLESLVRDQRVTVDPKDGNGLRDIEAGLLAQVRVGVPIGQIRNAVSDAFSRVRAQLSSSHEIPTSPSHPPISDLSDLTDANSELSALNEELLRELSEATQANHQLMQLLTKLQTDKLESRRKIIDLKTENHQLKAQLRHTRSLTLGELQTEGLFESIRGQEEETNEQQTQLEGLEGRTEEINEARSRLELVEKKKLELGRELESVKSQLQGSIEERVRLEKRISALERPVLPPKPDLDAAKSAAGNIAQLEKKCEQLESEKNTLAAALQRAEEHEEHARAAMQELRNTLENQRVSKELKPQHISSTGQTQSDLEQTVLRLQRLNSQLNSELVTLRKDQSEVMERLSQLQGEKSGQLADAQRRVSLRETNQAALEALQLRLVTMQEQLEAAVEERDKLQISGYTQAEITAVKEEMDALRLENKELAAVVKQIQSQSLDIQRSDFRSLDDAKQHLIVLTRQLANAEATNTILKRKSTLDLDTQPIESPSDFEPKAKGAISSHLSEELLKAQTELVTLREDYEGKVKALTEDNVALQASYEDLEKYCAKEELRYRGVIDNLKMEVETKSTLFQEQIMTGVKKIRELRLELEAVRGEGKEDLDGLTVLRRVSQDLDIWWLVTNGSQALWTRLQLPFPPEQLPKLRESLEDRSFEVYCQREKVAGEKLIATMQQALGANQ